MADAQRTPAGGQEEGVHVQVLLRCRPLSDKEIVERVPQVVTVNEASREVTLFQNTGGKASSRTFRFDKVFNCDSTQEKLFKQAIVPIVNEVMDGFNCTIFAYGQTGTGKTYTMEGGPRESDDGKKLSAQAGVIPRSIKQIFETIEASNIDSTVKVSFLELYNEELTDLMSFDDDTKKLRLLEDKSGVVVQGLEEVIVRSAAEIYQVLDRGTAKRKTAATLLNQRSSRSHSIFTITIHMKETTPEGEDVIKIGKLNLVDLAGSENISRSGAKDNRAREAGSINQSLLTLGRVITALVEHSCHIPYRDSKLTRLLRDSLGGRTKTCIIATIAPTVQCQDETISTLDYAHRAKNIRNRPELNQKISKTTMIKELAAEIEKLKLDLQCTREKNGVYLSSERFEQGELERVQLRESLKAVRAELEASEEGHTKAAEELQAKHAARVQQLQGELSARDSQLAAAQEELGRAQVALQERAFVTASLRRAEQSLAGFAEKLSSELGLCHADISQLAQRLAQGTELHAADRQCLQQVRDLVGGRIQQLTTSLAAALSGQSSHLAAIHDDVAAFRDQRDRDVSVLRGQLGAVRDAVGALQAATTQQLQALVADVQAGYDQVQAKASEHEATACAAARKASEAAEAAVKALTSSLDTQAAALEQMVAAQQQQVASAVAQLKEYHTAAEAGLQGAATTASQAAQAEQEAAQQMQSLMAAFTSEISDSLQKQQASLLSQVGQLVSSFTTQHSQAVAQGMAGLQRTLAQHSLDSSQRTTGLAAAATTTLASLKDMHGALTGRLTGMQGSLQSSAHAAHTAAVEASKSGIAAQAQHAQLAASLSSCITTHTQGVVQLASTASQKAATSGNSTASHVGTACGALGGLSDQVAATVHGQHEETKALVGALSAQAQDAVHDLQGFGSGQQAALQQLGQAVQEGAAQALAVPVPPLPHERERPQPPVLSAIQELMCPDEQVLLAQLRHTKKDLLKRGADARNAAAMLLSPALHSLVHPGSTHSASAPMAVSPRATGPAAMDVENAGAAAGAPPETPSFQVARSSKIPGVPSHAAPLGAKLAAVDPQPGSPAGRGAAARAAGMLVDRTNV